MLSPFAIAHAAALSVAAAASMSELRINRIPNLLPCAALVAAVVVTLIDHGFSEHVLGAVMAFVPAFYLWRLEWIGGGIVKLFLALGALVGARETIYLWIFVASVLSVLLVRRRRKSEARTVETAPILTLALLVTTFGARHLPLLH